MHKFLAVESGDDWADAAVEYMINMSGRSGKDLFEEYQAKGGYHGNGKRWFMQWCIDLGYCRDASEDELEVVRE